MNQNHTASNPTSLVDLVFEGRSKSYGAYQLQKRMPNYLLWSNLMSSVIIVLAFGGGLWLKKWQQRQDQEGTIKMQPKKVVNYAQLSAPPPIELSTPKPKIPTGKLVVRAQKKFLSPVVKPDEEVLEEEVLPTAEELKTAAPSTQNVEGEPIGAVIEGEGGEDLVVELDEAPPVVAEVPPVAEPPKEAPKPEEDQKVFQFLQKKPEFPGGLKSLMQFIATNITYPELARENGIEGTVVMEFIVEPDGRLSNIIVKRGIGGGCDEEASRVTR